MKNLLFVLLLMVAFIGCTIDQDPPINEGEGEVEEISEVWRKEISDQSQFDTEVGARIYNSEYSYTFFFDTVGENHLVKGILYEFNDREYAIINSSMGDLKISVYLPIYDEKISEKGVEIISSDGEVIEMNAIENFSVSSDAYIVSGNIYRKTLDSDNIEGMRASKMKSPINKQSISEIEELIDDALETLSSGHLSLFDTSFQEINDKIDEWFGDDSPEFAEDIREFSESTNHVRNNVINNSNNEVIEQDLNENSGSQGGSRDWYRDLIWKHTPRKQYVFNDLMYDDKTYAISYAYQYGLEEVREDEYSIIIDLRSTKLTYSTINGQLYLTTLFNFDFGLYMNTPYLKEGVYLYDINHSNYGPGTVDVPHFGFVDESDTEHPILEIDWLEDPDSASYGFTKIGYFSRGQVVVQKEENGEYTFDFEFFGPNGTHKLEGTYRGRVYSGCDYYGDYCD